MVMVQLEKNNIMNRTRFQVDRRLGALERLNAQLKKGKKRKKVNGRETDKLVELSEKDVKRIKKEITLLEERT